MNTYGMFKTINLMSYLRIIDIGPNPQAELLRPKSDENLKSHNCPLDMSRLWYQQTQYKDVK